MIYKQHDKKSIPSKDRHLNADCKQNVLEGNLRNTGVIQDVKEIWAIHHNIKQVNFRVEEKGEG